MCVALPGQVLEIKDDIAICDFSGNRVEARVGLCDVKPGDYVLVHAGCILQKVSKNEAESMADLFEEIGSFGEA